MKGVLHGIATSFTQLWQKSEGLSLRDARPARLFYVLAYSFELLFYAYYTTFLPTNTKLFGVGASMLMYIGHILMSLVIMLLWSAKFKRLINISVAVTLFGFAAGFFLPDGMPKLLFAVITMAGLGGCVTSARCGFAFAANNTERLLGVVFALAGRAVMNFLNAAFPGGSFWHSVLFTRVLPVIFLAGLAICLLRFREADMEVKEKATSEDKRGMYWALVIFVAFFALDGYTRFMDTEGYAHEALMYGIGKVIAIVLFVLVLVRLKKNIWHIWNLFFCLSIVVAVLSGFFHSPVLNAPVHILLGAYEIGWVAALYLLGCAQRRFASYKLLKQSTAIFVIVSPLTTLSDELAETLFPEHIAVITLIYVLLFAVAFFMASPVIHKHLFSAAWMDDLHNVDMTLCAEEFKKAGQINKENALGLTPREMEVFALLLTDMSFKQIAAALKISDNTIRFHSKNLYRKLNVQSRTELFAQHGKNALSE